MMMQIAYNQSENFAIRFAALAFIFYSQPVSAEQVANDNDIPQTETAQLGTPVTEATLVSASYSPPKAEDQDIFTEAYDFAKRSGTSIVKGIQDIKLSSGDTQQATAAPTVAVEQAPAQPEPQDSTWKHISEGATHMYESTIHVFDKSDSKQVQP